MFIGGLMKFMLASASPRRKELMKFLKVDFECIESNEEEIYLSNLNVYDKCQSISYHKALNVYKRTWGSRIVIGCDTIVALNGNIYGKPKSLEDAYRMLKDFSGKCHEVISAVTIMINNNGNEEIRKFYDVTKVYLNELSDDEINEWLNNNLVLDKAGAYAIQEYFGRYITKIEGDYYNIVGFPINMVYNNLKDYLNNDLLLK